LNQKTQESIFDLSRWSKLAQLGSFNAISGLSEMVNQEVKVNGVELEEVSVKNAVGLLGKPEDMNVGIYLLFSGNTCGQILLAFRPEIAFELVDMVMGNPEKTTVELGEMERSVLGEMGNIVGTFFLNALANQSNTCLSPSPPAVVMDMSASLMDSVMTRAMAENESVWVIKLSFSTGERELQGRFLVLPVVGNDDQDADGEE
jgi:chemotaxis protein CheC